MEVPRTALGWCSPITLTSYLRHRSHQSIRTSIFFIQEPGCWLSKKTVSSQGQTKTLPDLVEGQSLQYSPLTIFPVMGALYFFCYTSLILFLSLATCSQQTTGFSGRSVCPGKKYPVKLTKQAPETINLSEISREQPVLCSTGIKYINSC